MMWGYDEGWHEAEYKPTLGVWRWTSDARRCGSSTAPGPVNVTVRVESPARYFDELPTVRMLAGDRVLGETRFADSRVLERRRAARGAAAVGRTRHDRNRHDVRAGGAVARSRISGCAFSASALFSR